MCLRGLIYYGCGSMLLLHAAWEPQMQQGSDDSAVAAVLGSALLLSVLYPCLG